MRLFCRISLLLYTVAAAWPQTPPPGDLEAVVSTELGSFRVAFAPGKAPRHVEQFIRLDRGVAMLAIREMFEIRMATMRADLDALSAPTADALWRCDLFWRIRQRPEAHENLTIAKAARDLGATE